MHDSMSRLEKAALASAVSGAVFNVFLFGIGATLAEASAGALFVARLLAAVLTAASFDLVAVATVRGMRDGRRSRWSLATAIAAALVSALIALDVAGVWHQPWLHAANAIIVLAFSLHLMTPRRSSRLSQLRRLVRQLARACRQARQNGAVAATRLSQIEASLSEAMQRLSSMETTLSDTRQRLSFTEASLSQTELSLSLARQELAAPRPSLPAPRQEDVIRVVVYEFAWPEFERLVKTLAGELAERELSASTIRRRVKALAGE